MLCNYAVVQIKFTTLYFSSQRERPRMKILQYGEISGESQDIDANG